MCVFWVGIELFIMAFCGSYGLYKFILIHHEAIRRNCMFLSKAVSSAPMYGLRSKCLHFLLNDRLLWRRRNIDPSVQGSFLRSSLGCSSPPKTGRKVLVDGTAIRVTALTGGRTPRSTSSGSASAIPWFSCSSSQPRRNNDQGRCWRAVEGSISRKEYGEVRKK